MLDDCTPLLFKTSPSSKALFAVVTAWTLDPDESPVRLAFDAIEVDVGEAVMGDAAEDDPLEGC